jgi:hypothetical protein
MSTIQHERNSIDYSPGDRIASAGQYRRSAQETAAALPVIRAALL